MSRGVWVRPACTFCGKRPRKLKVGYCSTTCYPRWVRAGRPDSGPPVSDVDLWRKKPVAEWNRKPTDLDVGTAGEHLVCADLLLAGYVAFRTEQTCAYDVAVDLGGRLIRIQVKSTRAPVAASPRPVSYLWRVQRMGKGGRHVYHEDSFDLLALVALDIRRVAYLPQSTQRVMVRLRPPEMPGGEQFSDYPIGRAIGHVLGDPVPDVAGLAAGEGGER